MLERCLAEQGDLERSPVREAIAVLRDTGRPAVDRLLATSAPMRTWFARHPFREMVSPSPAYRLLVERELALFGAWYEIFPRSRAPTSTRDRPVAVGHAAHRGGAAARHRRDGFRRRLPRPSTPSAQRPARGRTTPWTRRRTTPAVGHAIGSPDGGHDSIHPDLGTFEDFDLFVRAARRNGLEVAIDIALQASPDHPYVDTHPEWFTTRADGTIAYAENPPKKYQDIYPLNFDNDPAGAYAGDASRHPGVDRPRRHAVPRRQPAQAGAVLAVADRRRREGPPRDHLAVRGVHEAGDDAQPGQGRVPAVLHLLRGATCAGSSGVPARALRRRCRVHASVVLAHDARHPHAVHAVRRADRLDPPCRARRDARADLRHLRRLRADGERRPTGAEEQVDNEKYEYKDRRWEDYQPGGVKEGQSLAGYLTKLNAIRKAHPSLRWLRNIRFHASDDENIIVFSKSRVVEGRRDDPRRCEASTPRRPGAWLDLDMPALGLGWDEQFRARDLVTEQTWIWRQHSWVRLGPETHPVHIIEVRSISSRAGPQPQPGCDTTLSGTALRSSTRFSSGPSRTRRGPGPATSAVSSSASTTCSGWGSTVCGCRRSTPRRCATAGTTSPTTRRCCRSSGRCPVHRTGVAGAPAASASSPTWS